MLLTRCLMQISIIILTRIFIVSLGLGLFTLYPCDLFFIFIFIRTMFNHIIISWIPTHLFFSYYFWMITWIKNVKHFQIAKIQPQGVPENLLDFLPISVLRCLRVYLTTKVHSNFFESTHLESKSSSDY